MKKEIYMNISIVNSYNDRVSCVFVESINDGPLQITEIPLDKACKLMWEIVLAGGRREVRVNQFDRNIVIRDAYIFLPN